jgi:uncharacterized protein YndB with AHSA1/START domain
MFDLRPEGLKFLETAPLKLVFAGTLKAAPEAVFYALAAEPQNWPRWYGAVTGNEYRGDGPHGVGSRRRVRLVGGVTFNETVLAWDSPSRYAYRIDRCTMPGLRALVEEWDVLETNSGTRVSWTMAIDAVPGLQAALRAGAPGVGVATRRALGRLERRLAER